MHSKLKRAAIAVGLLCVVTQARADEPKKADAWKKIASWRVPMPKAKELSGNELMIDGVRCRLFGVELTKDAVRNANAKRFLEHYMRDYGDYYSIYNDGNPVSDKDGVPLIWLKGHGNGGWAQEALVQSGLVRVNYTGFEKYHFFTPGKDRDEDVDWKKCFKDAEAVFRSGQRPNVNFVIPEKTTPK